MPSELTAPVTLPDAGFAGPLPARLEYIDNLRWVMIVLVVSMHAAVTYSHLGSWYFMEPPKPDIGVTVVFATYQIWLQAFFMGLLFLLAGYFVPPSLERKGFRAFIRDRAVRLGVPTLLFMLVVHPVTAYWLIRFTEPSRPSLAEAYLPYLTSGRFLSGSGPMWFALALLLFSIAYATSWQLRPQVRGQSPAALPADRQVIALILLMGLCTFVVRVFQPMGTNILNMQLCFFSQYVLLFWVGIQARQRDWLARIPSRFGRRWLALALCGGGPAWAALVLALLKTHSESKLGGGLTWQSAAFSFWESFFCVGVCLGLLVLFRDTFNFQNGLTRWLSNNSFAVYLFHTPLLIAVTLAMGGWDASKLLKFLCAWVLGSALSYLCSSLVFRRLPLLKRVL